MNPKKPVLAVQEIGDVYIRANFQALDSYFNTQNQLLDFKFFSYNFTEAVSGFQVPHNLGYVPQDVIVTRITGEGKVDFDRAQFTTTTLILSTTGPCKIRFFVGSYWNEENLDDSDGDEFEVSSGVTTAEQAASNPTVPIGGTIMFAGTKLPANFMWCNGASLLRKSFPELFEAIGLNWGSVDFQSFNIPDIRGLVPRGTNTMGDATSGRDPDVATRTALYLNGATGDNVGSYQADMYGSHYHDPAVMGIPYGTGYLGNGNTAFSGGGGASFGSYGSSFYTANSGGNETRGKNIYMNFIIRYK